MGHSSLRLDRLRCLVLDEAEEMLHMGFIDDVSWVLERIRQPAGWALIGTSSARSAA